MSRDADADLRIAGADDAAPVLAMIRDAYAGDHLAFEPSWVQAGRIALLADPARGEALPWQDGGSSVPGCGVPSACFSLQWGGTFGLFDERYLCPCVRGRGLGRRALDTLLRGAAAHGPGPVRLEVDHHDAAAGRMHLAAGFRGGARTLPSLSAGAAA